MFHLLVPITFCWLPKYETLRLCSDTPLFPVGMGLILSYFVDNLHAICSLSLYASIVMSNSRQPMRRSTVSWQSGWSSAWQRWKLFRINHAHSTHYNQITEGCCWRYFTIPCRIKVWWNNVNISLFNRSYLLVMCHMPSKLPISLTALRRLSLTRHDVRSYRPISNLSVLAKLLERLVARQLKAHLNFCDLFPRLDITYRLNWTVLNWF